MGFTGRACALTLSSSLATDLLPLGNRLGFTEQTPAVGLSWLLCAQSQQGRDMLEGAVAGQAMGVLASLWVAISIPQPAAEPSPKPYCPGGRSSQRADIHCPGRVPHSRGVTLLQPWPASTASQGKLL